MPFYSPQDSTATAAATADVRNFLGIARLQNQASFIGFPKDAQGFLLVNHASYSILHVVIGSEAEDQASLFWFIAAFSHDLSFSAADAGRDKNSLMGTDKLFSFFVGQNLMLDRYALSYGNGSQLRSFLPDFDVEKNRDVLFHISDKVGVKVIDMKLPDADDKLPGQIFSWAILGLDPVDQPFPGHIFKTTAHFVLRQVKSFGNPGRFLRNKR
jgi:hypothetical protein